MFADKQACGTLTVASNILLLTAIKAFKKGLRLGVKVGTTLFVRPEATYTATLHTSAARKLPVTMVSPHLLVTLSSKNAKAKHCAAKVNDSWL